MLDGTNSSLRNNVYAYDINLARTTRTALTEAKREVSGGSVGSYGIFAGGTTSLSGSSGVYTDTVDCYNASLTKSTGTALSVARGRSSSC